MAFNLFQATGVCKMKVILPISWVTNIKLNEETHTNQLVQCLTTNVNHYYLHAMLYALICTIENCILYTYTYGLPLATQQLYKLIRLQIIQVAMKEILLQNFL